MNLRIRKFAPLAFAATLLSAQYGFTQTKDGWRPLFNGKNLDGWRVNIGRGNQSEDTNHLVQVAGGVIHMYKDTPAGSLQPFGYIATEKDYANYHLRLEYQWAGKRFAPRASVPRDAGILYHAAREEGVWPRSIECQIQEGDVGDIWTVRTQVTTTVAPAATNAPGGPAGKAQPVFREVERGGVPLVQGNPESVTRIKHNAMSEHDGWNTVEVIVRGDSAKHIVNGKVNNQFTNLCERVGQEWKPLTKGRIVLQLEGAEVLYRNVEIKELKD